MEPIVQGGVYMNMGKPSLDIVTSMGGGSTSVLRISFIISSNFSEMFRIFTTLGVLFISNCILFSAGSKIPGEILFFPNYTEICGPAHAYHFDKQAEG